MSRALLVVNKMSNVPYKIQSFYPLYSDFKASVKMKNQRRGKRENCSTLKWNKDKTLIQKAFMQSGIIMTKLNV